MSTPHLPLASTAEAFALQWRAQLEPCLQQLGFRVKPLTACKKLPPLGSCVTSSLRSRASIKTVHVNHRVSLWSRRQTISAPPLFEAHLQLTVTTGTMSLMAVASTVALGALSGLDSFWQSTVSLALADPQSPLHASTLAARIEDCLAP